MKVLLNTNLLPIISVGMYESDLDPRNSLGCFESDLEEAYFWNNFSNAKYVAEIQRKAQQFIASKFPMTLADITIKMTAGEIYSPREYNFTTDHIDLTVDLDLRKLKRYIADNGGEFSAFLEQYKSCSGFISFTASTYEDWEIAYAEKNENEIAAALKFLFEMECEDDLADEFDQEVLENLNYWDFCDYTEFHNDRDSLIEFVQNNYMTGVSVFETEDEVWCLTNAEGETKCSEIFNTEESLTEIYTDTVKEIESAVGNLFNQEI